MRLVPDVSTRFSHHFSQFITSFGTGVRWSGFRLSKSKAYRPRTFARASGGIVYHTSCVETTTLGGNHIGVLLHLGFIDSIRLSWLQTGQGITGRSQDGFAYSTAVPSLLLSFTLEILGFGLVRRGISVFTYSFYLHWPFLSYTNLKRVFVSENICILEELWVGVG